MQQGQVCHGRRRRFGQRRIDDLAGQFQASVISAWEAGDQIQQQQTTSDSARVVVSSLR